jgi:hypothetical protein
MKGKRTNYRGRTGIDIEAHPDPLPSSGMPGPCAPCQSPVSASVLLKQPWSVSTFLVLCITFPPRPLHAPLPTPSSWARCLAACCVYFFSKPKYPATCLVLFSVFLNFNDPNVPRVSVFPSSLRLLTVPRAVSY